MIKISDRQCLHIDKSMVKKYIGSDNLNVDHLIDLLTELANGQYKTIEFAIDVHEDHIENLEA